MRRWSAQALLWFAPLIAVAPWASLAHPPAGAGRPRSCASAQQIDGTLRCDEEQATDLRELCPFAPTHPLEPGDRVDGCAPARMPPAELAALEQPVDLNRASLDELGSLPGVGPVIAARIVAARPFTAFEQLDAVHGIGPAKLAALRARARIRPNPSR